MDFLRADKKGGATARREPGTAIFKY